MHCIVGLLAENRCHCENYALSIQCVPMLFSALYWKAGIAILVILGTLQLYGIHWRLCSYSMLSHYLIVCSPYLRPSPHFTLKQFHEVQLCRSALCGFFYLINDWHLSVHRPQLISPTCCVTAAGSLPAGGWATLVCIHLLKVCFYHTVSITQPHRHCSKCRAQVWMEG